jgi:2',3'-cyclic-nucleotide 2'-phosphodiesterase (5'-nucleotidase family)
LAPAVGLAATLPLPQIALAETVTASLVQTNDIDRMEEDDGRGGFVRLAAGGGPANTTPDKIIEIDGIKLSFYGLTTEDTIEVSSPGDIAFLDAVETGIGAAQDLRAQGADIVIAVTHLPVDDDFALARADAADINIAGHDEHLMTFYDGKHVITESGAQGE